jgi:hypothetical protein
MKNANAKLEFFHDNQRHLVCTPFSVENLHLMAAELGIKRCHFHRGRHPHYGIPLFMLGDVIKKSILVSPREIHRIIHGAVMKTEFDGKVEIDHERGVIYVHVRHPADMDRFQNATVIRICGLPCPIPSVDGFQLDLNLGLNNWGDGKPHANWRGDGIMTDDVHKDSDEVVGSRLTWKKCSNCGQLMDPAYDPTGTATEHNTCAAR